MTSIYEFLSFLYTMSADMESAILHMIYTQIGRKSKNLSKNAMSEVHYSTKTCNRLQVITDPLPIPIIFY